MKKQKCDVCGELKNFRSVIIIEIPNLVRYPYRNGPPALKVCPDCRPLTSVLNLYEMAIDKAMIKSQNGQKNDTDGKEQSI